MPGGEDPPADGDRLAGVTLDGVERGLGRAGTGTGAVGHAEKNPAVALLGQSRGRYRKSVAGTTVN
ncbi:hypothetical protein M8I35_02695 [Micromonospora sp. MSM11]|nr:hypothetical protein [Micromonospora sp. MSM11]